VTDLPVPATTAAGAPAREPRPLHTLLPEGGRLTLVAAISVALAAGGLLKFGLDGHALLGIVLCPVLVFLGDIDLRHRLLPNVIVLPATLACLLVIAATNPHKLWLHLAAGVALGGFFFASAALIPGSIGMGDAKLGLLLGVALGAKTLPAMEISFLGVLVAALWIVVRHGMSARKRTLPFGPFLALGGILGFFLG
jgi:leader peptidase (prepilin peptidase)/N-methyltransferase